MCVGKGCNCPRYRDHAPEDFPSDNRLKIAALCGVLDFQLDSVEFELNRVPRTDSTAVKHYLNSIKTTLEELRRIALARPAD
jgi:hypothetical protein